MKKVVVIGGGAAGLMAAYTAAKNGNEVILIEKNEKLGKKIYITGKGRCNFTNDVAAEEFLTNVVRGRKFLTSAIYSFPPQKTIDFFEEYGLSIKIERGNRAFPSSDHASDVTKTLEKVCRFEDVDIHLLETVTSIMPDIITSSDIEQVGDKLKVLTNKNAYICDAVIVATGGLSYPATGSTGDGYRFAKENGHLVTDLTSALCGLNVEGNWCKEVQGLALKNVAINVELGNKKVYTDFGELLFTHFGISGPIVLSASSVINRLPLQSLSFTLDLKPALDLATLDKRLLRDFDKYKNKQIANALCELLPHKLINIILEAAKISPTKNVNVLTKEERLQLAKMIKEFPIKLRSLRGIEESIVTSGGIELSEINPKTMESKKVKGLYFCGEVLDVDAFTGGFNMQIAFATGYAAGRSV